MLTKPLNEHILWKGKLSQQRPSKLTVHFTHRTTEHNTYRISPLQHNILDNYQQYSDNYWADLRYRNMRYRLTSCLNNMGNNS
jgi:hypothetical protein